jgi:hypothetical protein
MPQVRTPKGAGATRRLFAAKSPFSVGTTFIQKGDLVDDGDPIYRKHRDMFEEPRARRYGPVERTPEQAPVEQATAAPGEHRHTHPHS